MASTPDILTMLSLNKLNESSKGTADDESANSGTMKITEPTHHSDDIIDTQDTDGEQSKSTDFSAKPPADFLENKQLKKLISDLKCLAGLQRYLLNVLNLLTQGIEKDIFPAHIEQMLRLIRKIFSHLTQQRTHLSSRKNFSGLTDELEHWAAVVHRQQVDIDILIHGHGGLEKILNKRPNYAPHTPAAALSPQNLEAPSQSNTPKPSPGPFQVN